VVPGSVQVVVLPTGASRFKKNCKPHMIYLIPYTRITWVSGLGVRVGCPGWVSGLGVRVGCPGWVSGLGVRVGTGGGFTHRGI